MLERVIKKTSFMDVLIIIISALAIVSFWRGMWNILDKYLFQNNFIVSQIVSIIFGIIVLLIIAKIK